jgi:Nucleotidyltransferase of unknown function (DUF6036)
MKHSLRPPLTTALMALLDKLDAQLRPGRPLARPLEMYVAGGMAVFYHCGGRHTEDVDASFSVRVMLMTQDLTVSYLREDGSPTTLYFDANYNEAFALMHPDYQERAIEWEGIGNGSRAVTLKVLTPLDLVLSKLSRYSPQDRDDVRNLVALGTFSKAKFLAHCAEALDYYVGATDWLQHRIQSVSEELK